VFVEEVGVDCCGEGEEEGREERSKREEGAEGVLLAEDQLLEWGMRVSIAGVVVLRGWAFYLPGGRIRR